MAKGRPAGITVESNGHDSPAPATGMVLRFAAGELRQRDVEKFMAAVRQSALGTSTVEHDGKVLRAAVACGWVVEPVLKVDKDRDDVADMEPWKVAAFARQIDSLYVAAMTVPKA